MVPGPRLKLTPAWRPCPTEVDPGVAPCPTEANRRRLAEALLDADASLEGPLAANDLESWSDDPVRMYLTQMGEIPLLRRDQE